MFRLEEYRKTRLFYLLDYVTRQSEKLELKKKKKKKDFA